MKQQRAESATCDYVFPEIVDVGVAEMAEEIDLRAAVARRRAELLNGQNQACATLEPRPTTWPVEPGSLAEAVYWYRQMSGQGDYIRPEHVIVALSNLGYCWRTDQRWGDAENAFKESLHLRRQYGDRAGEGHTWQDLGHLYRAQGRWAEAEPAFTQSLAIAREVGNRRTEAAVLGDLGVACAALGQAEKAIGYLEQAVALARAIGDKAVAKRMLEHLARISQRF